MNNGDDLSKTMRDLIKAMIGNGGIVTRAPGGFWHCGGYGTVPTWGTSTVHALVRRGVALYSEWTDGRNGRFPVAACLKEG